MSAQPKRDQRTVGRESEFADRGIDQFAVESAREVMEATRSDLGDPDVVASAPIRKKGNELTVTRHGGSLVAAVETSDGLIDRARERISPEMIASLEPCDQPDDERRQGAGEGPGGPSKAKSRRGAGSRCRPLHPGIEL